MLTAEQMELRRTGIGASEMPVVLGIHPDKSPIDVWLEKMGETSPSSEQTEIGDEFEEPIARIAARKLGMVATRNQVTKRDGLLIATADFDLVRRVPSEPGAVVGPRVGVLETKNVGYRIMGRWNADVDDDTGPPEYVTCQVQQQMAVEHVPIAFVAALLGGRDHRVYGPHRVDEEVIRWLHESAERWWRAYVETREPPPMDGSPAGWRALERTKGPGRPGVVEADADLMRELEQLRALKEDENRIAEAVEVKRQRVAQLIGEHEAVQWYEGKIRRVCRFAMQRGKVSWKAVAIAVGATDEIAEAHRGAPGRVLTLPRGWVAERGE